MEKPPKPVASIPPFGLRMQPALKAGLEESAKANARSLNAEIVARLQQSLDERPAQSSNDSYALSAIERLEGLLLAAEGQRDTISQQALSMATALTVAYPYVKAAMDANPALQKRIGTPLLYGMQTMRIFVSQYKPVGVDAAVTFMNNIQRVLGPAFEHLSKGEHESLALEFSPEASDFLKDLEARDIKYIKAALDRYGIHEEVDDVTATKSDDLAVAEERKRRGLDASSANQLTQKTVPLIERAEALVAVGNYEAALDNLNSAMKLLTPSSPQFKIAQKLANFCQSAIDLHSVDDQSVTTTTPIRRRGRPPTKK